GAPLDVLDIQDERARDVYGYDLLLLRPDLHVVWRGNRLPDNPGELAAIATGHNGGTTSELPVTGHYCGARSHYTTIEGDNEPNDRMLLVRRCNVFRCRPACCLSANDIGIR